MNDEQRNRLAKELGYRDYSHQRKQFDAILSRLPDLDGLTVLDFGCGHGAFSEVLPYDCRYLGVDKNREAIDTARELYPGREFIVSGRVRRADIIVAVAVLQCVKYPQRKADTIIRNARQLAVFTYWNDSRQFIPPAIDGEMYPGEDDFVTVVVRK